MVKRKLPQNVIDVVRVFRKFLEDANINVDSMIVFGSQAKGTERATSDIDVCVVSEEFGVNDVEEMQMLFKKARHVDLRIEPYPMSPKDLKFVENPIVGEITKWGILV